MYWPAGSLAREQPAVPRVHQDVNDGLQRCGQSHRVCAEPDHHALIADARSVGGESHDPCYRLRVERHQAAGKPQPTLPTGIGFVMLSETS
jgi:hypothetical protein